ncbi:DUF6968 family protein [Microvirga sp. 2TAF3]|uniref:DUF6968 family protein n=1 Tax=Microvirga sp. 2TAF3 TaxID=3233014 RepID=UPI003F9C756B
MLIATRDLEYAPTDGTVIRIPICLYAPEDTGQDWRCRFTIGWPDGIQESAAYGLDQMQALILTLQTIGAHLLQRLSQDRPDLF